MCTGANSVADSVCVAIAMATKLHRWAVHSVRSGAWSQFRPGDHGGCYAAQVSHVESPGARSFILMVVDYALLWTMDDRRATAGSGYVIFWIRDVCNAKVRAMYHMPFFAALVEPLIIMSSGSVPLLIEWFARRVQYPLVTVLCLGVN